MDVLEEKALILFGERVRELRKQKDWTQEELAFQTKLHRTYIGAVERGEQNISLKNIVKIATVLEVNLADMFTNWE
ncbi:MAG: helix-turn-helix transcriptional regulator [Anaerolineae bacterium]|nr:helix-turn-helix transcriptional regulator [Anaerolineae bacterium]